MLNGVGPVKSTVCNKGYRPLESGEGICADAEERVYIPVGPQVNFLVSCLYISYFRNIVINWLKNRRICLRFAEPIY